MKALKLTRAEAAEVKRINAERKHEFAELAAKTGWTDAELSRQLELTRGGVHGLLKGPTNPSGGIVKLLRYVVEDRLAGLTTTAERGATPAPAASPKGAPKAEAHVELLWERPVYQAAAMLREIQLGDPDGYKEVEKFIREHHRQMPRKAAGTKKESAAAALLQAAAKPAGSRRK